MTKKIRLTLVAVASSFALLTTSAAFACGDGKHGKSPEQRAERFRKADTNKDGFLTKTEVGDRRWEHMKAADANNDGKLSIAELEQAKKDGKLRKGGKGGKGGKGAAKKGAKNKQS
jgi:hypothetical protein